MIFVFLVDNSPSMAAQMAGPPDGAFLESPTIHLNHTRGFYGMSILDSVKSSIEYFMRVLL
jgi:hypothetical protein